MRFWLAIPTPQVGWEKNGRENAKKAFEEDLWRAETSGIFFPSRACKCKKKFDRLPQYWSPYLFPEEKKSFFCSPRFFFLRKVREKKAHEKLIQESLIEPASPYGASAAFTLGARFDV